MKTTLKQCLMSFRCTLSLEINPIQHALLIIIVKAGCGLEHKTIPGRSTVNIYLLNSINYIGRMSCS